MYRLGELAERTGNRHGLWNPADLAASLPPPLFRCVTLAKFLHPSVPWLFTCPLKWGDCSFSGEEHTAPDHVTYGRLLRAATRFLLGVQTACLAFVPTLSRVSRHSKGEGETGTSGRVCELQTVVSLSPPLPSEGPGGSRSGRPRRGVCHLHVSWEWERVHLPTLHLQD